MTWDCHGWSKPSLYQAGWVQSFAKVLFFLTLVVERETVTASRVDTILTLLVFFPLWRLDNSYWASGELRRRQHIHPAPPPEPAVVLWHRRRGNGPRPRPACGPLPGRPFLQPKWTRGLRWGVRSRSRVEFMTQWLSWTHVVACHLLSVTDWRCDWNCFAFATPTHPAKSCYVIVIECYRPPAFALKIWTMLSRVQTLERWIQKCI